jgi:type II/III secretion system protein
MTAADSKGFAMKLRFTIRDLLWLAVVVALAVAWWLDHRQSLRIYPVKSVSASEVVMVLSPALTADDKSIHIAIDERTNSIAVLATANQHVAIAKLIGDLDAEPQGINVEPPPAR